MLIADLAMPGMSGRELAHAARQSRPNLPILIVSGFANLAARDEGLPVLQKPFRAEELIAKVAAALDGPGAAPPQQSPAEPIAERP